MKFVAIDWGTSSFRAWLIEPDQIVAELESDRGVKHFSQGDHVAYLQEALLDWQGEYKFVIAIGMIGSSIGLYETKFSSLPIDLDGVFKSLIKVPGVDTDIFIVPGVQKPGDVMRGEESQSLAANIKDGVVVLPGTHSKWVKIANGEIIDFKTYLTGELFEIIRNHSTLSKATESSKQLTDSADFYKGLDAESENLTEEQLRDEAIMLAIRMRTGLALSSLSKQGQDNLQAYVSTGHVEISNSQIQLTAQGRLIADRLVREALGLGSVVPLAHDY